MTTRKGPLTSKSPPPGVLVLVGLLLRRFAGLQVQGLQQASGSRNGSLGFRVFKSAKAAKEATSISLGASGLRRLGFRRPCCCTHLSAAEPKAVVVRTLMVMRMMTLLLLLMMTTMTMTDVCIVMTAAINIVVAMFRGVIRRMHSSMDLGFTSWNHQTHTVAMGVPTPCLSAAMSTLGGSWVVISRVISKATIIITHNRGLITPLITTHEPPSSVRKGSFLLAWMSLRLAYGSSRKLGVPYFGVLIIRILLFRVLYQGPDLRKLHRKLPYVQLVNDLAGLAMTETHLHTMVESGTPRRRTQAK